MSDHPTSVIEAAIMNLHARQPKPRGRRQELAPYVGELRKLIAAGWTRAEIIAEIRALGGKMSPALLRDLLGIPTARVDNPGKARRARSPERRETSTASMTTPALSQATTEPWPTTSATLPADTTKAT